jgi:hypothetical protein
MPRKDVSERERHTMESHRAMRRVELFSDDKTRARPTPALPRERGRETTSADPGGALPSLALPRKGGGNGESDQSSLSYSAIRGMRP